MIDVEVETVVLRPPEVVAAYAGDPDNVPEWFAAIGAVEWRSEPPLRVGSELEFVAIFLGRRLPYTYRVVELVDGERLVMESVTGPFPLRTTYAWQPVDGGATRMTLRNQGTPSGFGRISAPVVAAAMKRALRKDLVRLKAILER